MPVGPPYLAPTQATLAMATHAIGRQFVFPDTSADPAIRSAIMKLAYLITAYGMVPNAPAMDLTATQQSGRTASSAGQHLLLVDDAADVLVSVGAFLVNAGFLVRKTASGDEALAIIASDPRIEVLVTDFAMPGLKWRRIEWAGHTDPPWPENVGNHRAPKCRRARCPSASNSKTRQAVPAGCSDRHGKVSVRHDGGQNHSAGGNEVKEGSSGPERGLQRVPEVQTDALQP